ncbi:uncharacterized protein GGS25DRAFT_479531 [Hypoxylon fragiforme]|uniref:uncharacterized protein n=1 Tax=Hypoxylon fragiforme TaxID=63214 RepID=UPI0020C6CEBA|nr:uncharacterized protein GGS25DRAFT_479531 [Hypoxylon fragiforme]KAI2610724.1 hypothetical protein GGS25DRAFT_479531 [Hypoxylon fragiforme]
MAVLNEVPGIEVTVAINNVQCVEYEDPDAAGKRTARPTSSKFVESIDEAKFAIDYKVHHNYNWGHKGHSLQFNCWVDNKHIGGKLARSRDVTPFKPAGAQINGMIVFDDATNSWGKQKLRFAAVKTVDVAISERVEEDLQVSRNIGVIKVEVRRCIEGRRVPYMPGHRRILPQDSFELAEKSLKGKAISHGATFSAIKRTRVRDMLQTWPFPGDNGPIAIFQFQYRSKKALQQELIIPSSPRRSLTLGGLSETERDRLAGERLRQIKEEEKQHVKQEASVIKKDSIDVIDLTGED